jgi:sec-independent protein translocase protein TatC
MENNNSEMSFLEHLEELRWHLIRSVVAVLIFSGAAFIFKQMVFDNIIMAPSKPDFLSTAWLCNFGAKINALLVQWGIGNENPDVLCLNTNPLKLQSITMAGQFLAHIKISLITGFVMAFPYIALEFWRFITPALHSGEKKYARGAVFSISLLFLMGVSFGYFIICPLSVNFLANYQVSELAENNIKLMSYVSTVTAVSFAAGVMFELPAIIYFLSKVGLVTPEFLRKYRKHSIVIILLLSAVITPPDIFSQVLVCFPLIFLYEISIGISKRIAKKRAVS